MSSETRYPCPCCGRLVFGEPPGSFGICDVCFWEDDAVQLRWPEWSGGANGSSLIDAQRNYAEFGAVEARFATCVRQATAAETLDEGWRPINVAVDPFEPRDEHERPWPEDRTTLYWWRPTYWRRA